MSHNPPYQNAIFNFVLMQKMLEDGKIEISTSPEALKHISVVGMLLPEKKGEAAQRPPQLDELMGNDLQMIQKTLTRLSDAGVPVHHRAQFGIYNLLPPISSDFLLYADPYADKPEGFPERTDLVILNYLPIHGYSPLTRHYNIRSGFENLKSNVYGQPQGIDKLVSVSRFHDTPDIWASAAFNAGASFIAVHGGVQDEINTGTMDNHPDSRVLICSKENEKRGVYSTDNMGIIAHAQKAQRFKPYADKNDNLGAAIINL